MRQHNERMAKRKDEWGRRARAALRLPKSPDSLSYLLSWYQEIRAGMDAGLALNPLSHGEILAYKTLYDLPMDAFDVDTLRRLDWLWLSCRPSEQE